MVTSSRSSRIAVEQLVQNSLDVLLGMRSQLSEYELDDDEATGILAKIQPQLLSVSSQLSDLKLEIAGRAKVPESTKKLSNMLSLMLAQSSIIELLERFQSDESAGDLAGVRTDAWEIQEKIARLLADLQSKLGPLSVRLVSMERAADEGISLDLATKREMDRWK